MVIISGLKYYSIQEAADLLGITPDAMKRRLNKVPELIAKIDRRNYISAVALKELVKELNK